MQDAAENQRTGNRIRRGVTALVPVAAVSGLKAGLLARRAAAAVLAPRLIHGDVVQLDDGYTLLLDFGCFHTLPSDRRPAYLTGVSHPAAPGAPLLIFGFRRRGPRPCTPA
jgi:hypothetical protein